METTTLGLDEQKVINLTEELNELLANFQVYYQNLRGVHWNIKGQNFFVLHDKFEELYDDAEEKIDMIAERILTLGETPMHTYSEYLDIARVPIGKNVSKDEHAVKLIAESIKELLEIERVILEKSDDADDEGTNAMMSDFISEQEKTLWMLKSWLA